MKSLFLYPLISLGFLMLPLIPAQAAFNPALVPNYARWVVYVDLNSLRDSALGKELIAAAEKAQLAQTDGKIGVDIQKLSATIGSVTAYGANFAADPNTIDGALIVQGTPDLRKIAEAMLIQATITTPEAVSEVKDLPFPAYALSGPPPKAMEKEKDADKDADREKTKDKTSDEKKMEVIIAFPPEPIVLVSKSRPQLLRALEAFHGKLPSIKAADSPLNKLAGHTQNAFIFAASIVPTDQKFLRQDGPQARILQMASAGSIALGERGVNTFAHAELTASSDAMADKLMKIVQGMTAMLSLAETNDKQLAEFLNSTNVSRDGQNVTLDLAYNSTRLAEMVKTIQDTQLVKKSPTDHPNPAAARQANMISGKSLAEWTAEAEPGRDPSGPLPIATRTIENVSLKNGSVITLARMSNGGKSIRFDRIEVVPAEGGAPLTLKADYMRTAGPRGNWQQTSFPGADGMYTLNIFYANDPDGKAAYAVSLREPRVQPAPGAPAVPAAAPAAPEPPARPDTK